MKNLVSHQLVRFLEERGVEHIFGLCGHTNIAVLDRARRTARSSFINTRHEQIAAHAADGYARIRKTASVVLCHLGPGLTNAATGVANAALDSIPMVVIAGDIPSHFYGKHPHQEINLHADAVAGRHLSAVRQARLARRPARPVSGDHRQGVPARRERPARPGAGLGADGHLLRGDRPRAVRPRPRHTRARCTALDRRHDRRAHRPHPARRQEPGDLCRRRRADRGRGRGAARRSSTIWAFRSRTR